MANLRFLVKRPVITRKRPRVATGPRRMSAHRAVELGYHRHVRVFAASWRTALLVVLVLGGFVVACAAFDANEADGASADAGGDAPDGEAHEGISDGEAPDGGSDAGPRDAGPLIEAPACSGVLTTVGPIDFAALDAGTARRSGNGTLDLTSSGASTPGALSASVVLGEGENGHAYLEGNLSSQPLKWIEIRFAVELTAAAAGITAEVMSAELSGAGGQRFFFALEGSTISAAGERVGQGQTLESLTSLPLSPTWHDAEMLLVPNSVPGGGTLALRRRGSEEVSIQTIMLGPEQANALQLGIGLYYAAASTLAASYTIRIDDLQVRYCN